MVSQNDLNKIVNTIVESVNPQKVILFGSRARKDSRKGSDYDFLIVKKGVKNEREISWQIYQALFEKKIKQDIDIIVVSPRKLQINKNNPYLIYFWALKEGKILYG